MGEGGVEEEGGVEGEGKGDGGGRRSPLHKKEQKWFS